MSVFGGGSGFGAGGGPPQQVSLNLTALMDILSNLLFFLLASYTTQALEVEIQKGVVLPVSSSQLNPSPDLPVAITRSDIQVANVPVVALDAKGGLQGLDTDKIPALFERLESVRHSREAAGEQTPPGGDIVLILADRGTDSALLIRVLKTAAMAGFANARFGVLAE